MKKCILIFISIFISTLSFSQNAASGAGYTFTRPSGTDCSLGASDVVRFGNGTTGWVEICMSTNNLVATCGGGNNKDDQVYVYQDGNNDGTPETFMGGFAPTTSLNSCFMTTTTNGYVWLLYCPVGTCDAGDKAASSIVVNWRTISSSIPTNNNISASQLIDLCGVDFWTQNIGANSTTNCQGTNAGPPTNAWYYNDFDCNASTQFSAGYSGGDVPYTVENDIWYKFCPGITGNWTLTLTPQRCYDPSSYSPAINTDRTPTDTVGNGYQYSLFQGTTTNLGSVITYGSNLPGVRNILLNVTSTANCYYLQIDGYAGNGCFMNVRLSPPAGVCTVMPVELIIFDGTRSGKTVYLNWVTGSELNNSGFYIEGSSDGTHWDVSGFVNGHGNSNSKKSYKYTIISNNMYFRLKQIDFDGKSEYSDIIYLKYSTGSDVKEIKEIYDVMGNRVDLNYNGIKIILYTNGSYEKVY